MTTGERIKARRKEIGMSAETLASIISVSPATIYRYEKGDIEKVPGDYLLSIANALHTSMAVLMGCDSSVGEAADEVARRGEIVKLAAESNELAKVDNALINLLRQLRPDEVTRVMDFVRGILSAR